MRIPSIEEAEAFSGQRPSIDDYIHEMWEVLSFDHEDLLKPIFSNGQCVYNAPSIFDMKSNLLKELTFLDNSIKRLYNPHIYPVGLEQSLYETKTSMILELRSK